jgi:peptide/nickel transport system permease protein
VTFARRLVGAPGAVFGIVVLLTALLFVTLAPFIAPMDPADQELAARLIPPFGSSDRGVHLAGTDPLGRDIASRIIWGARVSMLVGFAAVFVAGSIGVLLGLIAGYRGGRWSTLIMRVADVQLTIPFMVFALALVAAVGPSLLNLILVLGATGWVVYARVVRAETLSLREREFVLAARAVGVRGADIVRRHILPNAASSIIVLISIQVARMMLFEASLSFLGVGVPPPTPTWGSMIADGRGYLGVAWWVSTVPGLALFVTVLGVTLLGDRVRDILDPRLGDP